MPRYALELWSTLFWVLWWTAVFFWVLRKRPLRLPAPLFILFLSLIVRLAPALYLRRGALYEISVFRLAGDAILQGENLYRSTIAHSYLPMQLYWFAAARWLTENSGLFFEFWVKSVNILADVGITWLVIAALSRTVGSQAARLGGLLYAVNPVTLMVVSYQGQFDATTMLFLLLAWYLYEFQQEKSYSLPLSALFLGLAILNKTWPVLFLPIILIRLPDWRGRVQYTLLSGLVPLAGIAFYETLHPDSWWPIIQRGLRAGSISGWWGYSAMTNVYAKLTGSGAAFDAWIGENGKLLGRLAGIATIYFTREKSAIEALLVAILAMFALVPNLGVQGLSWVIPLAILLGLYRPLGWYTGAASLYMIIAYWGIHMVGRGGGMYNIFPALYVDVFIQLASLTIWLVIVAWNWQWWRHQYAATRAKPVATSLD